MATEGDKDNTWPYPFVDNMTNEDWRVVIRQPQEADIAKLSYLKRHGDLAGGLIDGMVAKGEIREDQANIFMERISWVLEERKKRGEKGGELLR